MRLIDLVHRWAGGIVGLLLAILGLTGAILVHRDALIMLPHADDPQIQDTATIARVTQGIMEGAGTRPESMIFASRDLGLHRLSGRMGAGPIWTRQAPRSASGNGLNSGCSTCIITCSPAAPARPLPA